MTASRLVIPDLAGKTVLITGGSTGIGAAVARGFAEQGSRVAIGYHSSAEQAHALVSEIKAAGGEALAVKGDVSDPAACAQIVAETTSRFGRLDGLINNAGLMLGRVHSLEASDEHVQAVIDLNARSIIWVTRAAAPWLERQGGFVINTTSIAARNGGAGGAMIYAAAKGFVSTITTRPRQGADRKEDPRQRGRRRASSRRRFTSAIPTPERWRPFARPFRSAGSAPPRNASAPICSSPRRR